MGPIKMTGNFSGEMRAWSSMNQTIARMTHQHHLLYPQTRTRDGWREGLEKRVDGGLQGEMGEGAGEAQMTGGTEREHAGILDMRGMRGMQGVRCPKKKGRLK